MKTLIRALLLVIGCASSHAQVGRQFFESVRTQLFTITGSGGNAVMMLGSTGNVSLGRNFTTGTVTLTTGTASIAIGTHGVATFQQLAVTTGTAGHMKIGSVVVTGSAGTLYADGVAVGTGTGGGGASLPSGSDGDTLLHAGGSWGAVGTTGTAGSMVRATAPTLVTVSLGGTTYFLSSGSASATASVDTGGLLTFDSNGASAAFAFNKAVTFQQTVNLNGGGTIGSGDTLTNLGTFSGGSITNAAITGSSFAGTIAGGAGAVVITGSPSLTGTLTMGSAAGITGGTWTTGTAGNLTMTGTGNRVNPGGTGGAFTVYDATGTGGRAMLGTHPGSTTYGALWLGSVPALGSNAAVLSNGATTYVIGPGGNIYFNTVNVDRMQVSTDRVTLLGVPLSLANDVFISRAGANSLRIGSTTSGSDGSLTLGTLTLGNTLTAGTTGVVTFGTASIVMTPLVLTSSSTMTIPLTGATRVYGTAAATTTFVTSGALVAGAVGAVTITGSAGGSTVTWPPGWSAMAYGTPAIPTTIGAGERIRVDWESESTGTGGLHIFWSRRP